MLLPDGVSVLTIFALFVLPLLILASAVLIWIRIGKKEP
jgi:hypothetical protein